MGNAAVPAPKAAALAVNGTVKGVVFQDFGSTGFFTTGNAATGVPRNRPIGGVTAQAFDADGGRVGTATSGSDGTYTINVSGARSNYLRVQFSGWDSNVYQPGFAAQSAVPANSLGENDTTVQFVELGTSDASHVDLSLVIPDQVIQGNAPIATAIEYAGDPSNASTLSTDAALVAQPWSDYGASEDPAWPFNRVTLATFGQVGAIWGTSYIRNGNVMLASPVVKRMSGLGGSGGTRALGNIYRVNDVLKADGTLNPRPRPPRCGSTWRTSAWSTRVAATSTSARSRATPPGGFLITRPRPRTSTASPSRQKSASVAWPRRWTAGRCSSRTCTTSPSTAFPFRSPTPAPPLAYAVKIPTPVGDNQQLWALSTYKGRLYLGYVDTGSRPGQSASSARLEGLRRIDAPR